MRLHGNNAAYLDVLRVRVRVRVRVLFMLCDKAP